MESFNARSRLSKALAEESSEDSESPGHPENDEAHDEAAEPVEKRHALTEKDSQETSPGAHRCSQEVSDTYSTTGIMFMTNLMTAGRFGE